MTTYNIQNAPQTFDLRTFKAIVERDAALAKSCRFAVLITPPKIIATSSVFRRVFNDLTYLCEATEFPGRGFNSFDLRYYGPNFKVPIQTVYEDLNMTFLCRTRSLERELFDDWMQAINPTNSFDFNYKENYQTTISLYQYAEISDYRDLASEKHIPTYEFTLYEAFPVNVNPQPVTWADDGIQRLTVTFTYTKWLRKGNSNDQDGIPLGLDATFPDLVKGRDNGSRY